MNYINHLANKMNKWDQIFTTDPKYKPLTEIFLERLLEKIRKEINPSPKSMIDLGCGTAETVFKFAKKGFQVTGIDFSRVALDKLQTKIDALNFDNIKLIYADLNDSTLKIDADIFLCNFVYAFINDKKFFLKNIAENMKDNSVFILITPVTHKEVTYTATDKPEIAVDFEETMQELKKIFSTVNIYHHDYISFREDYITFLIKK